MSAKEVNWYFLRQMMCIASREIVYVPTEWPAEGQNSHKRRQQMDHEYLPEDSTDILDQERDHHLY
jgi:hypothetical protein